MCFAKLSPVVCQVLLVLLIAVPGGVSAQDESDNSLADLLSQRWLLVDTEHFKILSQLSARETERLAADLETWRSAAARIIADIDDFPKAPVSNWVYLFEDRASFELFTSTAETGFFSATPRANYLALIATEETALRVAMHHYVHFLVRNFTDLRLPRWYEEALAGYVSGMQVRNNEVQLERYSKEDLELLHDLSQTLAMDRLLFRDDALASPRLIQIAAFKAQVLLHYFLHGYQETGFPDYREQLQAYLELILEGRTERLAFDRSFEVNTRQLEDEFHRYLLTSRRPQGELPFSTVPIELEYEARPLPGAGLAILLAEMALNAGNFENAEILFRRAGELSADSARAVSGLGDALRMQEIEGMDQQIAEYFQTAVAMAPDDPFILLDYGQYWEAELLNCDKRWPMGQQQLIVADVLKHFQHALDLVPNHPEAHLAMGQVYLMAGMDWRGGRLYQQRAFELLPADTFVLEQSVKYAIEAGEFDDAERLIDELAQPLHYWGEPGWVTDLRRYLTSARGNEPFDRCDDEN